MKRFLIILSMASVGYIVYQKRKSFFKSTIMRDMLLAVLLELPIFKRRDDEWPAESQ
ncbi:MULTISPECIES: hypothetical protein [Bacillaceae]|uniref:hypothetical protein n=1 Tax=Bacillaceae TaxID=186817 RepID=UPI000A68EEF0|nr:hypothetical protein [Bacillus sp. FJAT-27916]